MRMFGKAKAAATKVARKSVRKVAGLKKGAEVTITNRLYGIVVGRQQRLQAQRVFNTRPEARQWIKSWALEKATIIRLNDITGIVQ